MATVSKSITRIIIAVVVVAVVAGGVFFLTRDDGAKTVKAQFAAAVGVYPGTPVRQLGVNIGEVTQVKPKGAFVEISMEYDSQYNVPANGNAVEVANSLVSDRYIQLTAYTGSGPKMPSGATIPLNKTAAPAELDDIYKSLNTLSVALGPKGANKGGALSTLLKVGAANLKGNGAALGQSIDNLSRAAKTLSDGRTDLFGTVTNLRRFTGALKSSDGEVRKFNLQLAQVAGNLASERGNLGAALKQLGLALDDVNRFVKSNAGKLRKDVVGLRRTTNVLVRQKASLNETLAIAPVALANLVHSYQPNLGVIATRSNLASLTDPGQLCAVLSAVPDLFDLGLGNILGPLTKTIVSTCKTLLAQQPELLKGIPGLDEIGKQLGGLLGGGIGLPIVGG